MDRQGAWAPVAFVALGVALTCAFFPFPLLAAASGLLFGTVTGTALSLLGETLGAVAAFLIARHAARAPAERLAGPRLAPLRAAVDRRGFVAVLYARILPGVPRNLANYAFGLTGIALGAFAAATVIGTAPRAYAYTALGGSLGDLGSAQSVVAVGLLVALGVVGVALLRRDVGR